MILWHNVRGVVGSEDAEHCVYDVVLKFGPSCKAFTVDIQNLCEWCLTVHVDEVPKHWVVLWLQFGSCLGTEEAETLQKHDYTAKSDTGGRVSALSQRSALGSWTKNHWTSSAIWRQSWGSVRPVLYPPFPFLVYLVTRNTTTIPNRLDQSVTHNRQESPAIADKPARRESMPKLFRFDVLTTLSLTILAYLHSFSCCCVRNRRNPAKFIENSNLWSSRSSKVIDLGVNRKPICDLLLVINSNFSRICYRFRDIHG